MSRVEINTKAPDLELEDFEGRPVKLSGFLGDKRVLLVFNRGFM